LRGRAWKFAQRALRAFKRGNIRAAPIVVVGDPHLVRGQRVLQVVQRILASGA